MSPRNYQILTLALFSTLLFGCVSHKDIAKSEAKMYDRLLESEELQKVEQTLLSATNQESGKTGWLFTRVECKEKSLKRPKLSKTQVNLKAYTCDGFYYSVFTKREEVLILDALLTERNTILSLGARSK